MPERLRWAVHMLDLLPHDQVLEIGCGPGVAVSVICERLAGGCITAIDRSATAITHATERNAEHVASGKAVLQHVELARLALAGQRFDKVFAVNVNLFWVRPAGAELLIIKQHLRRNGVLHLFYETPVAGKAGQVAKAVAAALTGQGFSTALTPSTTPSLFCQWAGSHLTSVTGQRPPETVISLPVMNDAAGEISHDRVAAISSGRPMRPSGLRVAAPLASASLVVAAGRDSPVGYATGQ